MSMTIESKLTFHKKIHFTRSQRGRRQVWAGDAPAPSDVSITGRIPRISRLMALAIRFDDLIRKGEVRDYAELARLGHVTRARLTQIMNLLNLAPDLQEQLLFLSPLTSGRDPVKEWQMRPIAAESRWSVQRRSWALLQRSS